MGGRLRGLFGGWQAGGSTPVNALILIAVVVGGFTFLKLVGAYMDIAGMEGDLEKLSSDIAIECIGDDSCEDTIIEQIQAVRDHGNRQVTLDFTTLDYSAGTNTFTVEGARLVDLKLTKFTWRFTISVPIYK